MNDPSDLEFAYVRHAPQGPEAKEDAEPGPLGSDARRHFRGDCSGFAGRGAGRLTTTRVAERAGVSVGTLYQYFPHKSSLLYAVLQSHLNGVVEAVEAACRQHQGETVDAIAAGLVNAYLDAKTARVDVPRALYRVAAELDTADLIGDVAQRIRSATTALLASASTPNLPICLPSALPCSRPSPGRSASFSNGAAHPRC